MALIELDLTAPADPVPGSPPPAHRYRLAGLLSAAVLLVALGGSAPVVPQLWRSLGSVPAPDQQVPFDVIDGRLYTYEPADGGQRITAWALGEEPERLWSLPLDTVLDEFSVFSGARLEDVGDTLIVSNGPDTLLVDARTGAVRWTSPVRVTPLDGGRIGLVESEQFRPGTVYDQESGLPGPLYFSSGGVPHTEPPLRSEVRGVDLATGRTRWTAPASGSVNVMRTTGTDPAVLILSSTGLERRDGATGEVQRKVTLDRGERPAPTGGELIGGQLLVHFSLERGLVAAYDPVTLTELWARTLPIPVIDPPDCDDLLCAGSRGALDVLDPATGQVRWRAPRADLALRGGYVLQLGPVGGEPLRLVDPFTGATRVDLTGWQGEVPDAGGRSIVLRRVENNQRTTVFGAVAPDRDAVQPLGTVDRALFECAADDAYVVCREGDYLRTWAYRA